MITSSAGVDEEEDNVNKWDADVEEEGIGGGDNDDGADEEFIEAVSLLSQMFVDTLCFDRSILHDKNVICMRYVLEVVCH